MDEFDGFDPEQGPGEGLDGPDPFDDADTSSGFDAFDDDAVPESETDLSGFEFEAGAETGEPFDDDFALDAEFDEPDPEPEAEAVGEESPYAATYEDLLVESADNPAAFPPELDLDVPEPVDGYPWVDLDQLGSAETEPWVNTPETSPFTAADVDDVAGGALSRFWEM